LQTGSLANLGNKGIPVHLNDGKSDNPDQFRAKVGIFMFFMLVNIFNI
jgi:hypothetical protein